MQAAQTTDQWITDKRQLRTFPYMTIEQVGVIWKYAETAERILEFGGGGSTLFYLESCPSAEIHTIEEDHLWRRWVIDLADAMRSSGVKLASEWFCGAVLLEFDVDNPFDLILVDGLHKSRPADFVHGVDLLSDDGVMFLHDANEDLYQDAICEALKTCRLIHYSQGKNPRGYPCDLLGVQKR